jgi:hypothetical protein
MASDKFLYLKESGSINATTTEAGLSGANPSTVGAFKVVVRNSAYTGYVATTAQWTIDIQASADGTSYTTIASYVPAGVVDKREFVFTGFAVSKAVPNALMLRARAVKTGAPGDLTYAAYIQPV